MTPKLAIRAEVEIAPRTEINTYWYQKKYYIGVVKGSLAVGYGSTWLTDLFEQAEKIGFPKTQRHQTMVECGYAPEWENLIVERNQFGVSQVKGITIENFVALINWASRYGSQKAQKKCQAYLLASLDNWIFTRIYNAHNQIGCKEKQQVDRFYSKFAQLFNEIEENRADLEDIYLDGENRYHYGDYVNWSVERDAEIDNW